ncbi:hypothetical protein AGMMS49975_11960 [Clostridia bacterium]|nr:hypothetical protein AGMMS49975_11960 [Clostridia bacterium]
MKRRAHGKLQPKPPPDISATKPTHNSEKEFMKIFKQLTYSYSPFEVWKDFIFMDACAISNAVDKSHFDEREERYLQVINKYEEHEQLLFPELMVHTVMALEENTEQDFLGHIFMQLEISNTANGQFFTPYNVCQMMSAVTIRDAAGHVERNGYLTVHDPCCGAGATLIASINETRKQLEPIGLNFQNHVLVSAQDIDETVALMCYIQISLLGVAGYVKVGNALIEPVNPTDTSENYWFTPIYFSDVWVTRRFLKSL